MWICGPLRGAPPLSSPLHPFSWQRPQTAFSHAFPKSRYVDSIRLTSHNGEFVQQGEPHYLNPSVALSLPLWDRWTRLARSPQRLVKGRTKGEFMRSLWGSQALSLVCQCQVYPRSPNFSSPHCHVVSVDIQVSFTKKRTSKANWIIFIEWHKSMWLDVSRLFHIYLPQSLWSWSNLAARIPVCWFWTTEYFNLKVFLSQQ